MTTRNTSKLLRSSSSSGLVFCIHPIPSPTPIPVVPPTPQQRPPKCQSTKHCLQSGSPNVRISRLQSRAVYVRLLSSCHHSLLTRCRGRRVNVAAHPQKWAHTVHEGSLPLPKQAHSRHRLARTWLVQRICILSQRKRLFFFRHRCIVVELLQDGVVRSLLFERHVNYGCTCRGSMVILEM